MTDRNYDAARSMDDAYDADEAALVAFRKFATELADINDAERAAVGDIETAFRALDELDELRERVAALEAENEQLRDRLDRLGDIGEQKTSKEQKIAAIVTYADNVRDGEDKAAVTVLPKIITGVADVSRRYAYDLVDDMIREFPWAHDPDNVVAHPEQNTRQKGVLIDFEGVHGEAVAVNKFTTRCGAEGVAD